MSSAPKRPHDDSCYTSSKHPPDDSSSHPKLSSTVSSDYRNQYDIGPESRPAKVPRNESRDGDRRSPLHVGYRVPSSSNDARVVQPVSSESRLESRDLKDINDYRFENRDNKMDRWERDSHNPKSDKDCRTENRGDDKKDSRYERDSHNEAKSDFKIEKDSHAMTSSQFWKEAKEYYRGKRYSDPTSATLDSWHNSRGNPQSSVEIGKKVQNMGDRDHIESHEAVGENKVEPKADDRFKEKDRKRKDVNRSECVEKEKERNDCKSGIHVANSSGEYIESSKDEKYVDRLENDRKDPSKDKENLKEKEKDLIKREPWNGVEKGNLHNEKESVEASVKVSAHENSICEQKKQKEFDGWKNVDKEVRERKKERDADVEGDRLDKLDKRSKSHDKESDDGCTDAEKVMEKEREVFNHDVQQRKRMQPSRGSPQVANRDPHFRSHNQDSEGSPGKLEVSSVVYKVGECMQELIKLWKEHESSQAEKNGDSSNSGPTLEIHIPAEHVTATNSQVLWHTEWLKQLTTHKSSQHHSRQVRGGQLWGTDVYTYDSDLVAVLMHTGYCRPTASPPPSVIHELRATVQVVPPRDSYISTLRNNVRSRAWGAAIGCSYRIDQCCIVKKGGGTIDLHPCLTYTSTVEPTLAPMAVERTMTTRAAASNALRQQRFVREVTIQYNLCNEPWIKYSISIVADKGLKKPLYTSARLKKGEVLYLETHSCRYELCFTGEKMLKSAPATHESDTDKSRNHHPHTTNGERNDTVNIMIDVFRWSRCKKPLPQKVMRTVGIPLPLEHVEVVEESLDWEDIQWSQTGVWIAGKEYSLARVHFLSMN